MPQLYQLYLNYEIIVVDDNITTSIVITEPYMKFSLHMTLWGLQINTRIRLILFIYFDIFVE